MTTKDKLGSVYATFSKTCCVLNGVRDIARTLGASGCNISDDAMFALAYLMDDISTQQERAADTLETVLLGIK